MINRQLKDFFMGQRESGEPLKSRKEIIRNMLCSEELNLIDRFLTASEPERKKFFAGQLMKLTLHNIDPDFPVFQRLFEMESDKLTSMEKGAVYMKEDYRSHYIHSVYVYLLGFFLLRENLMGTEFLKYLNIAYFDTHYKDRPVYDEYVTPTVNENKEFQKRWALTAFFHDFAYLTEVNLKIMEEEGKRLFNIERPYSIEINDLQSFLTNPMMTKIKKWLKLSVSPGYLFTEDMLEILAQRMTNRLDSFSKDLIYQSLKEHLLNGLKGGWFDHGIMGAVFLLQQFFSWIYSFYICDNNKGIPHLLKYSVNHNILRFTDAMTAVSLHNIKNFKTGIFRPQLKVKIKNHRLPLAFLLILCDELQTWDREMAPPEPNTTLSILRAFNDKNKPLDKSMFISLFESFYRQYASLSFKMKENELVFLLPFQDEKGEQKEYEIMEENEVRLKIRFKIKSPYILEQLLKDEEDKSKNESIRDKIYQDVEKEAWKIFKKNNATLGHFVDLARNLKKFLEIRCPEDSDEYKKNKNGKDGHKEKKDEDKKSKESQEDNKDDKNLQVQSLEHLTKNILPGLCLLKKGQDKLSYLKPHHFHGIAENGEKSAAESKDFTLSLHYPGEEVEAVEKVLKKILEESMYPKKQRINLKYTEAPETDLNTMINDKYINKIEEYIYGIQQGKYRVKKINGGTEERNESKT